MILCLLPTLVCLTAASAAVPSETASQRHDPRTAPTRVQHALFTIEEGTGAAARLGDLDGDGADELLVQMGLSLRIYSGGSGTILSPFADLGFAIDQEGPTWAVGPDIDKDGVLDVAHLGHSGSGFALIVQSGRRAARLWSTPTLRGLPRAIAWTGDLDGDGVPDIALADPSGPFVRTLSGASGKRIWRTNLPPAKPTAVRLQNAGDRNADGVDDLVYDAGVRVGGTSVWISGRDGAIFEDALGAGGVFVALGDLDGDGVGDLIEMPGSSTYGGRYALRTSGQRVEWQKGAFPDAFPDRPIVAALGDVDGDGIRDLGVGDNNFNLRGPDHSEGPGIDLTGMTLVETLGLESKPWSVSHESGCTWVVSGATGATLMGVYGEPGSSAGIGFDVFDVGDQNGDGLADVGVRGADGLFVFASAAPTAPTVNGPFDWLPGRWIREEESSGRVRVSEELWLEPGAGRMLGVSRTYVRGDDTGGTFEFLRIERDAQGLALFAQPSGQLATRFGASEVGRSSVLFTNPSHDFPTQIRYVREDDELRAEVGTADEPTQLLFRWKLDGTR